MPPVELPNTVRVTFTWIRAADDEIVQTFHCPREEGENMASLTALAQSLATAMEGASHPWRRNMSGACTLHRVTAYDLHPNSFAAGEAAAAAGLTGTGNPGAHQVAAVITWLTSLRGPRFRGRTYVGPIPAGMLDTSGLITSGQRDQLLDGAEWLHTQFGLLGRPLQVASFTAVAAFNVIAARVDDSPDVQRRRQRRATSFTSRALPLD